ncbi:MAG: hypothetical protein EA412_03960 [Chitinophagaceae bacterium]|nr:MAG: hypothetical protein EA412_03960 [Chitinophagaceae bacterium]
MKYFLLSLFTFLSVNTFAQYDGESLQDLMFTENWFTDIEEAAKNPEKVWYLDLGLQKKRNFPEEIFTFKNLKRLYLAYNYYDKIPDQIAELQNLEILDLSGNYYLNNLPDGLWELKNLETLIIKDNRLTSSSIQKAKQKLENTEIVLE